MRTILVAALALRCGRFVSAQTPQTASQGAPQPQDAGRPKDEGPRRSRRAARPRAAHRLVRGEAGDGSRRRTGAAGVAHRESGRRRLDRPGHRRRRSRAAAGRSRRTSTTTYTLTMRGGPSRTRHRDRAEARRAVRPRSADTRLPTAGRKLPTHARRDARTSPACTAVPDCRRGRRRRRSSRGPRSSASCAAARTTSGPDDADDRQRLQSARHSADLHHAVPVSDRPDAEAGA